MTSGPEHKQAAAALTAKGLALIPATRPPGLPPTATSPDVPAWHGFEHRLWALGEEVRGILNRKPALRSDADLCSGFLEIVRRREGMRGRQSWVLLFARRPCAVHASKLALMLPDADIDGHVILALHKMRAGGFTETVSPFLQSPAAWIRKAATRYLEFDRQAERV